MMTSMPRFSAVPAYSKSKSGVRWAETTRVSCGTWSSASVLEANFMVSQSEPEPMMMPTRGLEISRLPSVARRFGGVFAIVVCRSRLGCQCWAAPIGRNAQNKECGWEAGATKSQSNTEGDILRVFSARGDLSAVLPIVAKLADQIERAGDKDGVLGGGLSQCVVESFFGVGNNGEMLRVVASDFGELRGGDGAGSAWRGENYFFGAREENAGDFVDGFIAKSGVDEPDPAAGEILFQEVGEFARGGRIVRAVEINVGMGLQFFETSGPDGVGDALSHGVAGDSEAAALEKAGGGESVESILQLETAGEAWSEFEYGS